MDGIREKGGGRGVEAVEIEETLLWSRSPLELQKIPTWRGGFFKRGEKIRPTRRGVCETWGRFTKNEFFFQFFQFLFFSSFFFFMSASTLISRKYYNLYYKKIYPKHLSIKPFVRGVGRSPDHIVEPTDGPQSDAQQKDPETSVEEHEEQAA